MKYLYLHGFASSPRSQKAQFMQTQFAQRGITLHIPDLNLGNFTELTVTAQLQYLQSEYGDAPVTILGSSLGGWLATQIAATNTDVEKLILLAPAFEFGRCLTAGLGKEAIAQWQQTGSRDFYHYGLKQTLPLKYQFFADAQAYTEQALNPNLPILIVHGQQDEVIPVTLSQDFAADHPNATLEIVNSDHSLGNVLERDVQLKKEKTHSPEC